MFCVFLIVCPPGTLSRGKYCYRHLLVDSTGYSKTIKPAESENACRRFNSYGSRGMLVGSNSLREQNFLNSITQRYTSVRS